MSINSPHRGRCLTHIRSREAESLQVVEEKKVRIQPIRNPKGQFSKKVCVNTHDRCFETRECPYCEVK